MCWPECRHSLVTGAVGGGIAFSQRGAFPQGGCGQPVVHGLMLVSLLDIPAETIRRRERLAARFGGPSAKRSPSTLQVLISALA